MESEVKRRKAPKKAIKKPRVLRLCMHGTMPKSECSCSVFVKECAGCLESACILCFPGTFRTNEDLCIYCRMEADVICKNSNLANRVAEQKARELKTPE